MKPVAFQAIWNSTWPHRSMDDTALRVVWGPSIVAVEDAQVLEFVRRWAETHTWPPSLHEFRLGTGLEKPPKPVKSRQVDYTCEYCGKQLTGFTKFSEHLDEDHKDELPTTEEVKAILGDPKKRFPEPEPPEASTEDPPTTGDAEDGSGDAEDGDAKNGNEDPDPPPEDRVAPGSDEDHAAAWELASRNLRDHDGAKTKGRSCTMCDDHGAGLLFRVAPWDVLDASVTKGVTILAANCWGCEELGRRNYFGMPTISEANRKEAAWKRFSNMVGTKGLRKKERARWINTALQATRRVLEWRAKKVEAGEIPPDPNEPPCKRCGDNVNQAGLLFAARNGGQIMAARCSACGGSGMYHHDMSPELVALPIASGDGWQPYSEVFEDKFDRIQMVAAAVKRTRKALVAGEYTLAKPEDSKGAPDPAPADASEAPQGAPEPELDDELPI